MPLMYEKIGILEYQLLRKLLVLDMGEAMQRGAGFGAGQSTSFYWSIAVPSSLLTKEQGWASGPGYHGEFRACQLLPRG